MMNSIQRNALRDLLFAAKFDTEHKEDVFRYLAVLPDASGESDAVVHYAYAAPTWERAGVTTDAETYLKSLIQETPFRGERIAFQYHDYLRQGWPIAWEATAVASVNNFPTLVLYELVNGRVVGALMRNAHMGSDDVSLAAMYVEPKEAVSLATHLQQLPKGQLFLRGLYKDFNIDAASLEEAIANTPETDRGQKSIVLYRNSEWVRGFWNNPSTPDHLPLTLRSLADFHGIPVSAKKRQSRPDLKAARAGQTLPGDYALLEQALAMALETGVEPNGDYEAHPAVKLLCSWWNSQAPEGMRSAGLFRVYMWSGQDRIFIAGDPEEPAVQAKDLAETPAYALFEKKGKPTFAVQFHRGREHNTSGGYGTLVYYANGECSYDIGSDISEVDEAYYAVVGLEAAAKYRA